MKPSKFFLVCLISVLTASLSAETIVDYVPDRPEPRPLQPFTANYAYKTAERVDFTIDGFALTAESGSIPPYPKFDYSGEKPYVRSSYIIDHNEK